MKKRPARQEGMNWVNPYLTVKDIGESIEFYAQAFGFVTRHALKNRKGDLIHADLVYQDCCIMLAPEDRDAAPRSPHALGGSPVTFYLYTEDVNALFERAKKAGATVIEEPTDQYWGDRTCSFECPSGHRWTFGQYVADPRETDID